MSVSRRSLKEVDDVTDCPICLQTMTNPKMLPCLHTFCLECIIMYGKEVGKPTCPVCRSPFTVVKGDYSHLPHNSFVEKLVKAKKSVKAECVERKSCDVCLAKDENTKAITAEMYCTECLEYMCDPCAITHKSMKMTKTHRLRPAAECLNLKEHFELSASYCERHPKQEIEIYCTACYSMHCVICYEQNHQSHKCFDIAEVADGFRNRIKSDLFDIEKLILENKKRACNVQSFSKEFTKNIDQAKLEIVRKSEEIKCLVDKHRSVLLEELEVAKQKKQNEYTRYEEALQRQMISYESFKRYAIDITDRAGPADVVRVEKTLRARAEELKQQTTAEVERPAGVYIEPGEFDKMRGNRSWNIVAKLSFSPATPSSTPLNYGHLPTLMKQFKLEGCVLGIAVCINKLFVLTKYSNTIQGFSCNTYEKVRTIIVQGMNIPMDIVSCGDSLFVGSFFQPEPQQFDKKTGFELHKHYDVCLKNGQYPCNAIVRIDFPSLQGTDWSFDDTTYKQGQLKYPVQSSLSITKEGNLLICCAVEKKLKEYTREGIFVRELLVHSLWNPNPNPNRRMTQNREMPRLPSQLLQAFHLSNDQFVVLDDQNYVCVVNNKSQEIKGNATVPAMNIFVDRNDSILVINQHNIKNKLSLLNSSLDVVKVIVPELPRFYGKMYLDDKGMKLYFTDIDCNAVINFFVDTTVGTTDIIVMQL